MLWFCHTRAITNALLLGAGMFAALGRAVGLAAAVSRGDLQALPAVGDAAGST